MIAATVVGNLGQDAELGDANGTPVLNFSVASNHRVSQGGKWNDATTWVRVALFGTRAESLAEFLTAGKGVAVRGELYQRAYETKNGENRTSLEMRADGIKLLGGAKSGSQNDEEGETRERKGSAKTSGNKKGNRK